MNYGAIKTLTGSSASDAFNYTRSFGPFAAGAVATVMPTAIQAGATLVTAPQAMMGSTVAGAVIGYYAGNQDDQWWMDALKGAAGATAVSMLMGGMR